MFAESEKINNIKSFLNNNFGEILIDTERKIFHNRNFIADKVDSSYFNLILGKLIYVKNENTFIDNKVLEKITYIKECKARNKIILSGELEIDYPDVSCNYYIYDLETEEIFNLFNFKNLFDLISFEDNIIFGTKQEIVLYPFSQKFNPLWHYDLGTKYNYFKEADYQGEPPVEVQAEVIKFLGVYKNELWLVLNSGLLALNIETGTETRYIKEGKMAVGEPFFEDFKGYFGYDTVLDEEKGIIFSLNLHFYIEYDLNSNKNHFDSYSFKASSEKNELHLNHIGGYDAENIYAYEGSKNNRFAIFSRDKKEIIWSEEIPEVKDKFPAIRNLQYGAGKIYVLDHYNTLHIFEKEK